VKGVGRVNDPAKLQSKALASGDVVSRADPRWVRLRRQIEEHALQLGDFTLASGRKSSFIFQLRQTTLHPEGAHLLADVIVDYMAGQGIGCIGGLALGAVPIVSAVAAISAVKNAPVDAFFVRKEVKAHGAKERIDGFVRDDRELLLVDDVATTGGSILKALEGLREEGKNCVARKALVIIDRQEGATENLAEHGIELVSIFKKSDFNVEG